MIFVVIAGVLFLMNTKSGVKTSVDFDVLFKKYASQYGLDWKMLKAICMNESSLGTHPSVVRGMNNPSDIEGSKSSDGKSWGIMQVTVTTARDFDSSATAEKLNNPEYSVRVASMFLQWVSARFKTTDPQRVEWIVKSYNQGVGNTQKEMSGSIAGYASEYWERYKRNYSKI
ncbi:MAG: transglycosylase SLT domain-containing protein [Pseudobdellovibrio sp.]